MRVQGLPLLALATFRSLMYFNDVWNKSHTHGIPQNAGDADETGRGGPRISVALLCAAAEDDPLSLTCGFKEHILNAHR